MINIINILLFSLLLKFSFATEFISIKEITNEANLRKGPGNWYPVKWIIKTPNLPLKVLEKGDKFDKVELHDGTQGWLSKILTSNTKNFPSKAKHWLNVFPEVKLISLQKKGCVS